MGIAWRDWLENMQRIIVALVVIISGLIVTYIFISLFLLPTSSSFDLDAKISDEALELTALPDSRNFRMGFTHQPFDWNEAAFNETSQLIRKHADTVTVFYDVAVPDSP